MFVSASSRCFSDQTFFEACSQLSDLEYDKIEIWMSEASDHLKPSIVTENPERFFQQYREETRMTPIAFCVAEDVSATAFEALCRLGKLMRLTQITLPAGAIGTPFNEEVDRLRERVRIANAGGIRLSLKSENGRLTEDPRTAVELCQSIPGLGITLDPSYYLCGPYHRQSLDPLNPHVFHTHLRDSLPASLQVAIGMGEIDYSRLIAGLKRFNYTRALSVELLPELMGDLDRARELRKIRLLLETLL